jgi:hypothetical protein
MCVIIADMTSGTNGGLASNDPCVMECTEGEEERSQG